MVDCKHEQAERIATKEPPPHGEQEWRCLGCNELLIGTLRSFTIVANYPKDVPHWMSDAVKRGILKCRVTDIALLNDLIREVSVSAFKALNNKLP